MKSSGFIHRKTALSRYTRINQVRRKPRPGRLKGEALAALREQVWKEQQGRCIDCGKWCPLDGDVFTRIHLAHKRNKRMWGDSKENSCCKCHDCHIVKEHNPKACPPKPKMEHA